MERCAEDMWLPILVLAVFCAVIVWGAMQNTGEYDGQEEDDE